MIKLSEEAVKVGTKVFGLLVEAHIRYNTSGKGTCNTFDIQDYPEEYQDIILAYVEGRIRAPEAIYHAIKSVVDRESTE